MNARTAVEAALLAAVALALGSGALFLLAVRPLGSALQGYEEIARQRAERAAEMPPWVGETIEVCGVRLGRGAKPGPARGVAEEPERVHLARRYCFGQEPSWPSVRAALSAK